ncbi:MAG: ABC transporter permease [Candidatus Acidiferrum sp.]
MTWIRGLVSRRMVFGDLSEEMRAHLEERVEELVESGMARRDAQAAARREFGNMGLIEEDGRAAWRWDMVEDLLADVRYGLRGLRKNLGFTVVALLTIAIGIGANAAVFSVVDAVMLRPLRYPASQELVALRQAAPGAAGLASFVDGLRLSPSMYFTYSEHNRSFQAMGVWSPGSANVTGVGEPEQVRTIAVTDGVLEALRVTPAVGRWLSHEDQIPNGPERVMLNYGYWQRKFGGDRTVVGRNIVVDSRPKEIVGVMPRGFQIVDKDFDLLAPLSFDRSKAILAGFGFQGIARLKPGVTIAQADADMTRMLPIWMDTFTNGPDSNPHIYESWKITPQLRPLKDEVIGNVSDVLWVVMGTIALVLLIACANVTNLFLVRGESRQQEMAVRAALGAGSVRIVRALLVESVMLGLMGGLVGVAIAYAGVHFLMAIGPANLPRIDEIAVDWRTLAFGLALSVVSGLLFGLIPALKYSGTRGQALSRAVAGRTTSASRERHRARNFLVVGQVAMALVLLVCAGLMIRTFDAMRHVQPGFTNARTLQLMRITIPGSLVPEAERVTRLQNAIQDKLAAIQGVQSVAFGSDMPLEGYEAGWDEILVEGKDYPKDQIPPLRLYKYVAPGFFATAGTRLIAGREQTWSELYEMLPIVMVSDGLARELWGSPQAAIGKRVREFPGSPWHEVIGVVEDVRENGVQAAPPETVYWPSLMTALYGGTGVEAMRTATFIVRSERAGNQGFVEEIRQAVWSVNSNLPVASVSTMQEVYDKSVARTSFTLVMLGIAGAMSIALGVVGIYGVISYTVSQRRREIGIRLALGAQRENVLGMVLGSGARMALGGVAIGVVVALGLTRGMNSLLFGVSAHDPLTFAMVAVLLFVVALAACWVPARRATRVDPMVALRYE